jgi:Fe-S cluster assembly protein SufD
MQDVRERFPLNTFTADHVAGLDGPDWLRSRRREAFEAFSALALPSEKEEVWRYSPIDELNLDRYQPARVGAALDSGGEAFFERFSGNLEERSALCIVHNGQVLSCERDLPTGAALGGVSSVPGSQELIGSVLDGGDALVRLNDAFFTDAVVIDIADGVEVTRPIVILHWCDGEADGVLPAPTTFARTAVRLGKGSSVSVVEVIAGPSAEQRSLALPVGEFSLGAGSRLAHVSLQVMGLGAWHLGRVNASVGRDASLSTFSVGLGGSYDRMRTDAVVEGTGGSTQIRSAYLGSGTQIHDIRTLQEHAVARTTSDLLCMGAVAECSRSIYSGLIRVRHGAVKTDARQTNHNLVLDPRAHADSVPNLDIEENDVRCSHASTVGPVDADQLYYLESRGIPPDRAERLIVLGFFKDIVEHAPIPSAIDWLHHEVAARLTGTLDSDLDHGAEGNDG